MKCLIWSFYIVEIIVKNGGSAWESNPPGGVLARHTGFEDQGPHQIAVHFRINLVLF